MGPVIAAIPADGRAALRQGEASFAVPRQDLLIEYLPVRPDHRNVLANAPLLVSNADAHRRAGINLATLALHALRAPGVVEPVRQAPFPGIHALLDAVGDAPIEPDDAGDARITLPDDADGTVKLRLDELPSPAPAPTGTSRTWRGGRRNH